MASVNRSTSSSFPPEGRRGRGGGVDLTGQSITGKLSGRRSNSLPDLSKIPKGTSKTQIAFSQENSDSDRGSAGSSIESGGLSTKSDTSRKLDSGISSENSSSTTPPSSTVDTPSNGTSDDELAVFYESKEKEEKSSRPSSNAVSKTFEGEPEFPPEIVLKSYTSKRGRDGEVICSIHKPEAKPAESMSVPSKTKPTSSLATPSAKGDNNSDRRIRRAKRSKPTASAEVTTQKSVPNKINAVSPVTVTSSQTASIPAVSVPYPTGVTIWPANVFSVPRDGLVVGNASNSSVTSMSVGSYSSATPMSVDSLTFGTPMSVSDTDSFAEAMSITSEPKETPSSSLSRGGAGKMKAKRKSNPQKLLEQLLNNHKQIGVTIRRSPRPFGLNNQGVL